MNRMFPMVSFDSIARKEANELLVQWQHKMGPIDRGNTEGWCHCLFYEGIPQGVTCASTLIRECVGGGLSMLTRDNTVELSRLCAIAPSLCRVVLRLWREFVFPTLGYRYAISYQDAHLHNGNIYRFDGWLRAGYSHSGTDTRSGRKGRAKWIWIWPHDKTLIQ
jgi:hypothetical protein